MLYRFCPNCGNALSSLDKFFCSNCGSRLPDSHTEVVAQELEFPVMGEDLVTSIEVKRSIFQSFYLKYHQVLVPGLIVFLVIILVSAIFPRIVNEDLMPDLSIFKTLITGNPQNELMDSSSNLVTSDPTSATREFVKGVIGGELVTYIPSEASFFYQGFDIKAHLNYYLSSNSSFKEPLQAV